MEDPDVDTLSPDDAFDAIRIERRRAVIDALLDGSDEYSLDALTHAVAARTAGSDAQQAGTEAHRRLKVALLHHHLPVLDELDIVELDGESQTVRPGQYVGEVDDFL